MSKTKEYIAVNTFDASKSHVKLETTNHIFLANDLSDVLDLWADVRKDACKDLEGSVLGLMIRCYTVKELSYVRPE